MVNRNQLKISDNVTRESVFPKVPPAQQLGKRTRSPEISIGYSINLELTDRKSAVLTPSSLACLSKTATINLTSGCAHGCVYCYTKGYSSFPGESTVRLYANTAEKLEAELLKKCTLPKSVYFSPSSDLFQPVPEVLEMGLRVLKILLDR